jgi:hypothetical protein
MKSLRMISLAFALTALLASAAAQTSRPANPSAGQESSAMPMPQATMPRDGTTGMMRHPTSPQGERPTEPGQAAFGAIHEIVGILEADPHTDWSKVDIDALRQHLIDMDEVTMRATARKQPIENGLRIEVTGSGRTLEAIQRMVPDHARAIDGMNGWTVRTTAIPNGVLLTVTATNPTEVQKIRGLGFMGIMVQGSHHQPHHLAMAKGEPIHMHQ